MTLDQPLYALAKQVQWYWPETHGEEHFVVVLGGLHIEMCCLKMIGDWLQDSGWIEILTQSGVASHGTAESFLKACHVSRTRRVHEITVCGLFILMNQAFHHFLETHEVEVQPSFEV